MVQRCTIMSAIASRILGACLARVITTHCSVADHLRGSSWCPGSGVPATLSSDTAAPDDEVLMMAPLSRAEGPSACWGYSARHLDSLASRRRNTERFRTIVNTAARTSGLQNRCLGLRVQLALNPERARRSDRDRNGKHLVTKLVGDA